MRRNRRRRSERYTIQDWRSKGATRDGAQTGMRQASATNIHAQDRRRGGRITPEEDRHHGQASAADIDRPSTRNGGDQALAADIDRPSIRKGGETEVGSRDDEANLALEATEGFPKSEGIEPGHGDAEAGLDPEAVAAKILSTLVKQEVARTTSRIRSTAEKFKRTMRAACLLNFRGYSPEQ